MSSETNKQSKSIGLSLSSSEGGEVSYLFDLLERYTNELRSELRRLQLLQLIFSVGVIFALVTLSMSVVVKFMFDSSTLNRDVEKASVSLLVAGGVTFFLATYLLFFFVRMRYSTFEVQRLKTIVYKLIRRGSQLIDKGNVEFGSKIIVEILLSDAESLIRRKSTLVSILPSNLHDENFP